MKTNQMIELKQYIPTFEIQPIKCLVQSNEISTKLFIVMLVTTVSFNPNSNLGKKKSSEQFSQVKRSPNGKIQLFLSSFKNGRKIEGTF